MNSKDKVAVLGGSFDPPTIGHFRMSRYLIDRMGFDEVWIMPAYVHTFQKSMSDFDHRFNMCKLMFNKENIVVSDFQKTYDCGSSTLNLFNLLHKKFNNIDFYMVIGSDNANVIHKWINHEQLIHKVRFVVIERTNQELNPDITWCRQDPHIYVKDFDMYQVSSTIIRNAVKDGLDIHKFTSPKVIKYIEDNNLYK